MDSDTSHIANPDESDHDTRDNSGCEHSVSVSVRIHTGIRGRPRQNIHDASRSANRTDRHDLLGNANLWDRQSHNTGFAASDPF